jgi:hypothetical protein
MASGRVDLVEIFFGRRDSRKPLSSTMSSFTASTASLARCGVRAAHWAGSASRPSARPRVLRVCELQQAPGDVCRD